MPNLAEVAKGGARFTDFYAACPVCSPTRASILTGRYPQRVNITTFLPGRPDRPDLPGHHLARRDDVCAGIGLGHGDPGVDVHRILVVARAAPFEDPGLPLHA